MDHVNFKLFATAVSAQFDQMKKEELFAVELGNKDIFLDYLSFFPEGTNPVYLERTDHDCSCCKNFIRNIGAVIGLNAGKVVTVWDVKGLPAPYQEVADKLAALVRSKDIQTIYRTSERVYGKSSNAALIKGTNQHIIWNHFEGKLNAPHFSHTPGAQRSVAESDHQVFTRGLKEISLEAVDTVLGLIADKQLYKGAENLETVKGFRVHKVRYQAMKEAEGKIYAWSNYKTKGARVRNSSIGELLLGISAGKDLETAIRAYETMVAPQNYKRPKALVTPAMVEQANKKVIELGLETALQRRFATVEDISVKDVLFVDNSVAGKMKDGGLAGILGTAVKKAAPKFDKYVEVALDKFISEVIPGSKAIELLLEDKHLNNLVSLTAPREDSGKLYNWKNDFGWAYKGGMADSIKQRVKAAGGKVDAPFRVSLAWFNTDDLDLAVRDPKGNIVSFRNKRGAYGELDVDMNVGGNSITPVENIHFYKGFPDGLYNVEVNNYTCRNPAKDVGFELEMEINGEVSTFSFDSRVHGRAFYLEVEVKNQQLVSVKANCGLKATSSSKEVWGVKTKEMAKVAFSCLSPNHWGDSSVGAKHLFFFLEGCRNPEPTRGFFNEFLNPELTPHKRVFELLGEKILCEPTDNQLSGVGFSSGRGDSFLVSVDHRPYKVNC